ncbi:unnamed protein product [Nezara viridula]|uniref:Uncharacterized protein n=1 Tax=Nezara viridula TaxID=85310 RepID=A0A9P0GXR4_NEZVI|nr:unnamed protein product [Nezara viridula]
MLVMSNSSRTRVFFSPSMGILKIKNPISCEARFISNQNAVQEVRISCAL